MGKEDLLSALYCEFINRVNEVGVDVNRAIAHPHTQSLVQYVCGLGPRKGFHLLKVHMHTDIISVLWYIGGFLALSAHLITMALFCADSEAEQHSSGKQNPAGHYVPHGA